MRVLYHYYCLSACLLFKGAAASKPVHLVHILADDLG
jgi:hypothetical protein